MHIVKAVLIVLMLLGTLSAFAASPTKGKYIIQYGFDVPTSDYVRKNIAEIEKVPFDGITISDGVGWRAWSRDKLSPADVAKTIDNLKNTKFKRYKHNLIPLISYFPDDKSVVDWFEPEWSSIAYNAALVARAAKQGKCVGIIFDAEQYGDYKMWNYEGKMKNRPLEEVKAKVKQRGREFIRAINKEFKNPVILVLWSYELPIVYPGAEGEPPVYALLIPFLDGLIEAAAPGTVLVDGYEYAYGYISKKAFMAGKKMIKDTARNTITSEPKAFDRHVQFGSPVYPDMWSSQILPYDPDNPSRNLITPDYFQTALHNAMLASDKYVWVYNENFRWFNSNPKYPATAAKAYIEAISKARTAPAPGPHPDKIEWPNVRLTSGIDNWSFLPESTPLEPLAVSAADFDDSSWQKVKLGEVPAYSGKAWYRYKFDAWQPADNKRVFLTVTSKDEFADIWVNGQSIGRYDLNRLGPNGFYVLEITSAFKPGTQNIIALRMENTTGESGITAPIKLTESGPVMMK